jgi:hypothetical protein
MNSISITPSGAAPALPSAADLDAVAAEATAKQATAVAGAGPEEVLAHAVADFVKAEAPAPVADPVIAKPDYPDMTEMFQKMAFLFDALAGSRNTILYMDTFQLRAEFWKCVEAFDAAEAARKS